MSASLLVSPAVVICRLRFDAMEGWVSTERSPPRGEAGGGSAAALPGRNGAGCQTRTDDLMLTRQLLYPLS